MPKDKSSVKRPLVLATTKPYTRHNIPEYTVASYNCECGYKGAVQAGLNNPHCSECGCEVTAKVVATASAKKISRIEDCVSTVSLNCASCDTHNLMATATALDFDGKTHCVSCGQGLEYDTADVVSDDDIDLDNDTGSDDIADTISANADSIDDITDEDEEEGEESLSSVDDDDEDIEDLETADLDEEDESSDVGDEDDYLGGDAADNPEVADGESEDDLEGESVLDDSTPVLAMLSKKELATARLVSEPDAIHIFAGHNCIATAKVTEDNKKVFGKEKHRQLITASLKADGLQKTIASFGFKPATIKVKKTKVLQNSVERLKVEASASLNAKLKDQSKTMQQALEIASLGFTRDAFANEFANPLKDAMFETLRSLGVDSVTASVKVQRVFADAGDEYSEILIAKAADIAAMPASTRNHLASTFASMAVPTPNFEVVTASEQKPVTTASEASSYFAEASADVDQQQVHRLDNPMRASTTANVAATNSRNSGLSANSLFAPNTLR